MHPLAKTLIVLLLVGGAGFTGIWYYKKSTTETLYRERMDALAEQWTSRLGDLQSMQDSTTYQEEMGHQLKWYFAQLQSIRNRFPSLAKPNAGLKSIDARIASGHIPKNEAQEYKQFYAYADKAFETLQSGDYDPNPTGTSASMHMDIYSIKPVSHLGEPRLRIDFMLWGAPHRIEKDRNAAGVVTRKVVVPITFTKTFFQFIGADGKVYGEMTGDSGAPALKIDDPSHWVPGFPPGAVLGTWWVAPFPPQAAKVVWELDITGSTDAGNPINADFKWDLDVPDAWKSNTWQQGATKEVRDKSYIDHPVDGSTAPGTKQAAAHR